MRDRHVLALVVSILFGLGGARQSFATAAVKDAKDPLEAIANDDTIAEEIPEGIEYLTDTEIKESRPWVAPSYGSQTSALGWSTSIFEPPPGLRDRVAFWKEIYTKYTTDQGLIHDSVHLNIVYDSVDFRSIHAQYKTPRERRRVKEKLIKEKKAAIAERLSRLHTLTSLDGLTGEDLRIWRLFEHLPGTNKFKEAASKKRIRFQLGQRDKFILGIYYSGRYLKEMESIFRDEGLPIELTRLPFVESSFNLKARSRVGASGIWQFMRRTARPYMKVNAQIDERNDPLRATRASARMLRANYQMLEAWPLAITGYNHGPNGVKRIADKVGSRDLAKIIDVYSSRTFGFASENFYACFLAALDAERNAKTYYGEPRWGPVVDWSEHRLNRSVDFKMVLKFFDGDRDAAELANPHLSSAILKGRGSIPPKSYIRVPSTRADLAADWLSGRLTATRLEEALRTNASPPRTPSASRSK